MIRIPAIPPGTGGSGGGGTAVVGLVGSSQFTIGGSPVTGTGTLTLAFNGIQSVSNGTATATVTAFNFIGATVTSGGGTSTVNVSASGTATLGISVVGGTVTVSPISVMAFSGATVADAGGGQADITIAGGGGPTFPGGIPLTGAAYPQALIASTTAGDEDIYTVPAGKRALIMCAGLKNNSGVGNIIWYIQIKISSTYYRLTSNTTTGNGGVGEVNVGYIAEAGEIVAVNTTTNNGGFVAVKMVVFDDSVKLFSAKKYGSWSAGDNTLYTVPSSTTAFLLSTSITTIIGTTGIGGQTSIGVTNASGATRTYVEKITPSGGSATSASGSNTVTNGVRGNLTVLAANLGAADAFIVNTDASTDTQFVWLNVMELT